MTYLLIILVPAFPQFEALPGLSHCATNNFN